MQPGWQSWFEGWQSTEPDLASEADAKLSAPLSNERQPLSDCWWSPEADGCPLVDEPHAEGLERAVSSNAAEANVFLNSCWWDEGCLAW